MKKDGHFQIPLKKSDPIIYQAQEVPLQTRLLGEFRAAKGLKARLVVAYEILKSVEDLDNKTAAAAEVLPMLNTEIVSHQRTQPALALEAIFVRDEIRTACGVPAPEGELTSDAIWSQNMRVGQLLEQIPAAKQDRKSVV